MGIVGAFDEIWGGHGGPDDLRPEFSVLSQWVADTPQAELRRRQQSAEATFRQLGITFAVYGDSDVSECIIPFDIVPRVFLHAEWQGLFEGLISARRRDPGVPGGYLRLRSAS